MRVSRPSVNSKEKSENPFDNSTQKVCVETLTSRDLTFVKKEKNLLREPGTLKPGVSAKAALEHVATISHHTVWGVDEGACCRPLGCRGKGLSGEKGCGCESNKEEKTRTTAPLLDIPACRA